jgi:hypothetical protein
MASLTLTVLTFFWHAHGLATSILPQNGSVIDALRRADDALVGALRAYLK